MAKVIAFTKKNMKFSFLPEEDSFQYLKADDKVIVAVADGITRDPIGIGDYPSEDDKPAVEAAIRKYPNPSPAKFAADEFCNSFIDSLGKLTCFDEVALKNAFRIANEKIRDLNKKHLKSVNYLYNDYWACVASGGVIINTILYWGYVCDCGICVYDKSGNLKFRTPDDMKPVSKYIDSLGKNFGSAIWRKEIRSRYRNNQNNLIDSQLVSYGALTGEYQAMGFVKVGRFKLDPGDYVLFYSDGMEEIIYSKEFKDQLPRAKLDRLREFSEERSKQDKKYEREGTLVLVSL